MSGTLVPGIYSIMNVGTKTVWGIGEAADVNPIQGFKGIFPPMGQDPAQYWVIDKYQDTGLYTMWNVYHPHYASMNSTTRGAQVYLTEFHDSNQYLWDIVEHRTFQYPSYYTLVNKFSGNAAENNNGGNFNGNPIKGKTPIDQSVTQAWLMIKAP